MLTEYQINKIVSALLNREPISTLTVKGDAGIEHKRQAQALAAYLRGAGLTVDMIRPPEQSGYAEYDISVQYRCENESTLSPPIWERLLEARRSREATVNGYAAKLQALIKAQVEQKPGQKDFVITVAFSNNLIELKLAVDRVFQNSHGTTYEVTSDYVQYATETNLRIKNLNPAQFVPKAQTDARSELMFNAAKTAIENLIKRSPNPRDDRWSVNYDTSSGGGEYLLNAMKAKGFTEGTFGLTSSYIQYQAENHFWVLKSNFPELRAREVNQLEINRRESEERDHKIVDDIVERLVFEFDDLIFKNRGLKTWSYQHTLQQDLAIAEKISVEFKKQFPGLILQSNIEMSGRSRAQTCYTVTIDPQVTDDQKLNRLLGKTAASSATLRMSQAPAVAGPSSQAIASPANKDLRYYLGELLQYARGSDANNYQKTLNDLLESTTVSVPENVMISILTVTVEDRVPTAADAIKCLERLCTPEASKMRLQ